VVAIIAAFNEGDVIEFVVRDLIRQGVDVYFLDDGSTDDTVDIVERYLGHGVIGVEHLADTLGSPSADEFRWQRILLRKAQLARELSAHWFIHHDADEFRESPWPHDTLKDAIHRVDALGFNAIDFALVDFFPVHDHFQPGSDVREAFTVFAQPRPYDRLQIRAWKRNSLVDLASSGGHDVRFPDRKVFPVRFILRHYPIRGQSHGERKVFHERRGRFLEEERARGWHIQYDEMSEGGSFIRDPSTLTPYDGEALRLELLLHHRGVEELTALLHDSRLESARLREEADTHASALRRAEDETARAVSDLKALTLESASLSQELERRGREFEEVRADLHTLDEEVLRLRQQADRQQRNAEDLRAELHGKIAEASGLRLDVDTQQEDLRRLHSELEHRAREVQELHHSWSWRVTRPLRAAYDLLSRKRPT
jgi:glycosyltransferase involved in cell wall biosynthesis